MRLIKRRAARRGREQPLERDHLGTSEVIASSAFDASLSPKVEDFAFAAGTLAEGVEELGCTDDDGAGFRHKRSSVL